jgi:hypothetical protein
MGMDFYLSYSSVYAFSAGPKWRVSCLPVVEMDDHLPCKLAVKPVHFNAAHLSSLLLGNTGTHR